MGTHIIALDFHTNPPLPIPPHQLLSSCPIHSPSLTLYLLSLSLSLSSCGDMNDKNKVQQTIGSLVSISPKNTLQ